MTEQEKVEQKRRIINSLTSRQERRTRWRIGGGCRINECEDDPSFLDQEQGLGVLADGRKVKPDQKAKSTWVAFYSHNEISSVVFGSVHVAGVVEGHIPRDYT